ncbi:uncharacterized protein O3C94_022141 [Discoglossus pictus]
MFTWIEKVIPQPPETPNKTCPDGQEGSQAPRPEAQRSDEKVTCAAKEATSAAVEPKTQDASQESEKSSGGVLTWLAQGLGRVVPQPADSPTLTRANKEISELAPEQKQSDPAEKRTENGPTAQSESSSSLGVLSWLSQGLEKVVPQPAWNQRSSVDGGSEAGPVRVEQKPPEEKITKTEEVFVAPPSPVHTPAPAPAAVSPPAPTEVQPVTGTKPETTPPEKGSGSGVLTWLMQGLGKVVPQPEPMPATLKKVEEEPKEEPPAPGRPKKRYKCSLKQSSMVGFSFGEQGLEKHHSQRAGLQDKRKLRKNLVTAAPTYATTADESPALVSSATREPADVDNIPP